MLLARYQLSPLHSAIDHFNLPLTLTKNTQFLLCSCVTRSRGPFLYTIKCSKAHTEGPKYLRGCLANHEVAKIKSFQSMQNGAKFFDAEKYSIAISNLSFVLDVKIFDKCSRSSTFRIQDFCQISFAIPRGTHFYK